LFLIYLKTNIFSDNYNSQKQPTCNYYMENFNSNEESQIVFNELCDFVTAISTSSIENAEYIDSNERLLYSSGMDFATCNGIVY